MMKNLLKTSELFIMTTVCVPESENESVAKRPRRETEHQQVREKALHHYLRNVLKNQEKETNSPKQVYKVGNFVT